LIIIALNTEDVKKSIESFKTDYVIIDTPGQLELFVFREAGKYTVKFLHPERSIICYILDPALAKTASGFVAQFLLSITTNLRLVQPQINILSKSDLLSDEELDIIKRWSNTPEDLYSAVINEEASVYREMSEHILQIIRDLGGFTALIPTSKLQFFGIDDIYTEIQLQFKGGEDVLKD
jgi:hypothetical protein